LPHSCSFDWRYPQQLNRHSSAILPLPVDYDAGAFEGTTIVSYTNTTGIALSELFFRLYANDPGLYGTAFVQILDITIQIASVTYVLYLNDTVVLVPPAEPLHPNNEEV